MKQISASAAVLSLIALCASSALHAGEISTFNRPLNFTTLFTSPVDASPMDKVEREQALSFAKNLDLDDFRVTGFVASRRPESGSEATADYRTYIGVRYQETLANSVHVSGHTFYGKGTYDGDNSYANPNGGGLPEEVRADGKPVGEWVGTDWKVNTRLFDRQSVQAQVEYRQPLATRLFEENRMLTNLASAADPAARKSVALSAGSSVALIQDVSLNAKVRLDPNTTGYEVGMEHAHEGGVRTGVSYAAQQISDPLAPGSSATLQRHLTKVNVGVPFLSNRFTTAAELQYNDLASPILADGRRNFVVGNLTASGQLLRDTRVSFGLQNVFDTRVVNDTGQAISFMPQDGRSLRFDLKRTF